MNIYEFITPSDPITFKADDDKVAFTCALILGNGKAGCKNLQTNTSLPTILFLSKEPEKEIADFIGGGMGEFIEANRPKISECLLSFAYGGQDERREFDAACESITDPKELKEFKAKNENTRSSMSRWVNSAWEFGESILKKK